MNDGETSKQRLLQFRARTEELIQHLNTEVLTFECDEHTRDCAKKVKQHLIKANNEINEYRLWCLE